MVAVGAAGFLLRLTPWAAGAQALWMAGLILSGAPVIRDSLRALAQRRFASDLVASLSIIGAVVLDEPLAGLVIVLMRSGGEALDHFAEGRATDAVRALEEAAPMRAHRQETPGEVDIPVSSIVIGDRLLVRPGELIPCDGIVAEGFTQLDTSSITGESLPLTAGPGSPVLSGFLNSDRPFVMRATALAQDSQYARIVELVHSAQASKAPIQRLADRYAAWFTPLTLAVCAGAWLASGDPARVLAVLVVATPCPLILAAPVAILGGINRGARQGILFLHGSALEQLTRIDTMVVDKTGTLTVGEPRVARIIAGPGFDEATVLRLAASAERGSSHPLAQPILREADHLHLTLSAASAATETSGRGIRAMVDGQEVLVGSRSWICEMIPALRESFDRLSVAKASGLRAAVAIQGQAAGFIEFADQVRPGIAGLLQRLRQFGVTRILLLSGDSTPNTEATGATLGITEALGDLLPGDKTAWVNRLRSEGRQVVMIGDGINDAPALAAASVGVALSRGHRGITSESADIVLTSDDPTRLADAMMIARHTMVIARQSIGVGVALSIVAMAFAAGGMIPPVPGALLQEAIDVAVILNALRAIVSHPVQVEEGFRRPSG